MTPHEVPAPNQTFAELLRLFRLRSGLSQGDLASLANLSARTISDLERGVRRRAYLPTVEALSRALGLTPSEGARFAAAVHRARSRSNHKPSAVMSPTPELPQYSTSFVGREAEVEAIVQHLLQADARILTVTGPPGSGKTRLAIEAARAFAERQTVNVAYHALDAPADAEDLLARLPEYDGQAFGDDAVLNLLVVDNLEHLRHAAARFATIVRETRCVRILATSRVPTFVDEEQEFVLMPLALEQAATGTEPAETAASVTSPATLLLAERLPDPGVHPQTPARLHALARSLGGLPLAIEAAAAFADSNGIDALMAHDPLDLPSPPDARTLRQTLDASYRLLATEDQRAFRRLAVFPGSWALDDAVDFLMAGPPTGRRHVAGRQAHDMLHRIAQHSLVQWTADLPGVRFHMLGLVRAYALELLHALGEDADARDDLVRCAMDLSEDALGGLEGEDANLWLTLLSQRAATFDAAISELVSGEDGDSAATLLWNLRQLVQAGFYAEADDWVRDALACGQLSPVSEGRLRILAACQRARKGYTAGAWRHARRGLALLASQPWERIQALRMLPLPLHGLIRNASAISRLDDRVA